MRDVLAVASLRTLAVLIDQSHKEYRNQLSGGRMLTSLHGHACLRQQETVVLHGVDVTYSRFLSRPSVLEAAAFAAEAHRGQTRLTGDAYISHCVQTALIVEGLLALSEATEDDARLFCRLLAVAASYLMPKVVAKILQRCICWAPVPQH